MAPASRDPGLWAILALALVLRLVLVLRPLGWLDDAVLPDDAWLSLTIARNLARGLGPWYGLAPTNGFQPLYVLLASAGYALAPHAAELPIRLALGWLMLADLGTIVLLYRAARALGAGAGAARVAALLWAVSPYAIESSVNGLETSLAVMLALAAFVFHLERFATRPAAEWRTRDALRLGLRVGLAGFARIDALLAAPALALAALPSLARERIPAGRWMRLGGAAAAGVALVTAPWLGWFATATGRVLPVSGAAVRHLALSSVDHAPTLANLYLPMARRALDALVRKDGALAALALLLLVALAARGRLREPWQRLRPLAALAGFCAILIVAYAGFVFGPWYFVRYFVPVALLLTLVSALWLDVLVAGMSAGARRGTVVAAVALALAVILAHPTVRRLASPHARAAGYGRVGRWAAAHVPPGTVVGGSQTGGLGYFADSLVVVNLDGVVNAAALDAMTRRDLAGYMRGVRVRWLIWQDDIEFIGRESHDLRAEELQRVDTIPGVSTGHVGWSVWRFGAR